MRLHGPSFAGAPADYRVGLPVYSCTIALLTLFCRLMGVYQYNVGQADSHWALLGSAIKVSTFTSVSAFYTPVLIVLFCRLRKTSACPDWEVKKQT